MSCNINERINMSFIMLLLKELETYWTRGHEKKELAVFTTLEDRVASLMQERYILSDEVL